MKYKILPRVLSLSKKNNEQKEYVKNLNSEEIRQLSEELTHCFNQIKKPIIDIWESIKPIIIKMCDDYKKYCEENNIDV